MSNEKDLFHKIWDMQGELNKVIGRDTINDPEKQKWIFDYITALEQELAELKDCLNWKWWSKAHKDFPKHGVMDKQNLKVELIDIMHFYISLLQCAGLTPEEILNVYSQKHQVNLDRQKSGYDHRNKTEEDNKSIVC